MGKRVKYKGQMMPHHTMVYYRAMGYEPTEFVPCEICSKKAVDIHHRIPRGMGGSKLRDTPENLMALCRSCHEKCEAGLITKEQQKEIHLKFIGK